MELSLSCDKDEPGRCSRGWRGSLGTQSFVATDYETYYIMRGCNAGYNNMKALYVGASEPLQVGTSEYATWYS